MERTFTRDEQIMLKKAAFGAVQLLSMAYPGVVSTAKENIAGAKVLTGATGIVGDILMSSDKYEIAGNSAAEVAADVLPALTATIALLKAKAPAETENFRTMVSMAVDQAASSSGGPNPAQAEMIAKIKGAMASA